MGRRGKKFDDNFNDNEDVKAVIDEVSGEIRDILTELEIYERTWIVPWFVQKLLNDLCIRLSLLVDKLGRGM